MGMTGTQGTPSEPCSLWGPRQVAPSARGHRPVLAGPREQQLGAEYVLTYPATGRQMHDRFRLRR